MFAEENFDKQNCFCKIFAFLNLQKFSVFCQTDYNEKREREKEKICAFFACERNAKNVNFFAKLFPLFAGNLTPDLGILLRTSRSATHPFKEVWMATSKIELYLPSALAVVCLREKLTLKKKFLKSKN